VLGKYAGALASVKMPPAYTFEYAFEHHGDRPQERTHRVYRTAIQERDEILSVNGERFARPQVRIFERRRDRYEVRMLAPSTASYAFTYAGPVRSGKHLDYVFETYAHGSPAYEVTRMTIDGVSFLPRTIVFKTRAGSVAGSGEVTYAKADRYWMPQTATARAEVNGKLQTERIAWARYRFYPSLPPSTFAKGK
jgi:hypothetical protein